MAPVVQELTLTITEATSTFVTIFPVGSNQARTTVNYVTQTLTYPTTTIVVVDIASTPTSTPSTSPSAQGGLTGPEKGAIAGSVLGFFLILILFYCCCCCGSSSSSYGETRTRRTSPKTYPSEQSPTGGYLPPDLEVLEVQTTSISNVNVGSNKLFTEPNQPVTEITPRSVPTKPDDKTVKIVDAGNQPSSKNVKEATTKKNSQPSTGAPAPNSDNAPLKTEPPSKREPSSKTMPPLKTVPLSETEVPPTKSSKDLNEQESPKAKPSPDEQKSQPQPPNGSTGTILTTDPLSSNHSAHSSDKPSPDTQSDQPQSPPTKPTKYPSPPPTPPRPQLLEIRSPETQDLPALYRRSIGYTDTTRITRADPSRPGIFLVRKMERKSRWGVGVWTGPGEVTRPSTRRSRGTKEGDNQTKGPYNDE